MLSQNMREQKTQSVHESEGHIITTTTIGWLLAVRKYLISIALLLYMMREIPLLLK